MTRPAWPIVMLTTRYTQDKAIMANSQVITWYTHDKSIMIHSQINYLVHT